MKKRIKKTICMVLISLMILTTIPQSAFAQSEPYQPRLLVSLNGDNVNFTTYGVQPVIKDGRTLIPVRALFEEIGARVSFYSSSNEIIISKDGRVIRMHLNSKYATILEDGQRKIIIMDTPPVIINSRSLVPLRYVIEALDSHVEWNGDAYQVEITDADYFYTQFENKPSLEIINKIDEALKILPEEQKEKLIKIKEKIQKENKTLFVGIQYKDKINELLEIGDRSKLTSLKYEINSSTLKSDEKKELRDYLDEKLKELNENIDEIALSLVIKTEESMDKEDYDNALKAIYNMKYSNDRSKLINRLNKIINEINSLHRYADAKEKLQKAEEESTATNISIAFNAINILPRGIEKEELLKRYKTLENKLLLETTQEYVTIAELSLNILDYNRALEKVNELNTSTEKSELKKALDYIKEDIQIKLIKDAEALVELAVKIPNLQNYNLASSYVEEINDTTTRKLLEKELADIKDIVDIDVLVSKAEKSLKNEDITDARNEINLTVLDDEVEENFIKRLNAIENKLELENIKKATSAVILAERTEMKPEYDAALLLVNQLNSGSQKTALSNRLTALSTIVVNNYYKYVEMLVSKVESTLKQSDYDNAMNNLDLVTDNDKNLELKNRLNIVKDNIAQKIIEDTIDSVELAEASKKQSDLDDSRIMVNKLDPGTLKTELTTRLNNLQKIINN